MRSYAYGLLRQFARHCLNESHVDLLRRYKARWTFICRYGPRYYRMSVFKQVDGFLMDEEALQLYHLAKELARKACPLVVEIGSWLGKSSVVIGSALLPQNGAQMYCIDPFDATGDARSQSRYQVKATKLGGLIRDTFEANLRLAGVASVVNVLPGLSHNLIAEWSREIDMLFIDGNHAFEAVKQDFIDWSPFVKLGGVVAFHDAWFSPPLPNESEYHTGPAQALVSWYSLSAVGNLHVMYIPCLLYVGWPALPIAKRDKSALRSVVFLTTPRPGNLASVSDRY